MKIAPPHLSLLYFTIILLSSSLISNTVALAQTNRNANTAFEHWKGSLIMSDSPDSTSLNSQHQQLVRQAKKDLAQKLSIDTDKIKLLEMRPVTWPDSSLGCPKKGQVYSQQIQAGFLIRLQANKQMYFYHSAATQKPFLCQQSETMIPQPGRGDEFIPPPGIKSQ